VALVDAVREPLGRQRPRDLRAVQRDLRNDRARQASPTDALGELVDARVHPRLLEVRTAFELERAMDLAFAEVEPVGERNDRRFGAADRTVVADEVAVEVERPLRGDARRLLERGVAARVAAGVEVGEAKSMRS
jgi:hypothetical protein